MAEHPMLPFWTDAYLGDTGHLSTIEHGAYLLLLITAWRSKDGTLPDDDKMLARYCRLTVDKWKKIRPIIANFFVVEDGLWKQGRLLDERKAISNFKKSQSKKAKDRHLKNKETTHAAAELGICRKDASPSPTPSPTPEVKKGERVRTLSRPNPEISAPEIQMAVAMYNETAKRIDIPICQKISDSRKAKLKARLRDCGGLDGWRAALEKLEKSDFLKGGGERGFKADFDFMLQEKSFTRLMEGFYDNTKPPTLSKGDQADAELKEFLDRKRN